MPIVKRILAALVLLALLPLVLVPVYAIPFVHPVSTLMLADWMTFSKVERDWVPLESVSPVLIESVVMSEDGQFCRHHGIDWGEMRAVVEEAMAGEETRGASTITMQTAKNLFLWNGRSFVRKAMEAPLALYVDLILPKHRIMEIYLNIAEWAPGVYGIEAASWHYFGKPAEMLTRREAALLARTLPAPATRNPGKPSASLSRLADRLQRLVRSAGDHTFCLRPAD
ncbi:monofunctional biosynthetic peptidoglycan transglycosylase [Antarcticirhabdus aurantiaca]|uniref:Monofunctional biosynthetic peptidoglycan transglycosylase n=1 Tax=Antarcticirhabdus aurantiaca TaxID=2606717 RepID=A0ACD4NIS5_9HYPH|nr:monofunctional biosynthetic peptidoglycan transglycosylase [Antarcticirhabdus aurantiaca]WAJ26728.1 monofunctional biosynthetic peptidoglycan transglycosylase [Jeongeuplla avenae]